MTVLRKKQLPIAKRWISLLAVFLVFLGTVSPLVFAEDAAQESGDITVFATFDVSAVGFSQTWPFTFNDNWFRGKASRYDHDIAKASLGMSMSAFRPTWDPDAAIDPSLHVRDYLLQCGFTSLREDDYDKNPSLYTVSTMIGSKQVGEGKDSFTLLAVGICGGGYANEWLSNFTIGDENDHAGFCSAANEVYDRIFGYIAEQKLQGNKLKVWVSGWSRSGGIANILGTKLADSDYFGTDDVFVYTFGCPMTTKEPGEYPNIFNICGKMDPVPNVPFADWGYKRNGTTLFLPSIQTDSDYAEKLVRAKEVYQAESSLVHWDNVEWDTESRVIMNYLLKIAPNSKVYTEHVQEHVINIYETKQPIIMMRELFAMANDEQLINSENRSEANSFLTYLAYTLFGYTTGNDLAAKYSNKEATLSGNLLHGHSPDVYLAWLFSTDDASELYSSKTKYMRVVINGDVDVAILGQGKYRGLVKVVRADGSEGDSIVFGGSTYDKTEHGPDIFMDRSKGQTIILLPKDQAYDIVVYSNRRQTVDVHAIALEVGKTNGNFNKMHYADLEAGQYDVIRSTGIDIDGEGYYDIETGDTFDAVDIVNGTSQELAIDLERSNILKLSWKQIVVLSYLIPTVLISSLAMNITWFIGRHRLKRKKREGVIPSGVKYDGVPSACIIASLGLFFLQDIAYWLMPSYTLQRTLIKLAIGVMLSLLCIRGYRKQPSELSKGILAVLLICIPADIAFGYAPMVSIVLISVAGIVLCWAFFRFERQELWQFLLGVVFSCLSGYVMMRFGTTVYSLQYPLMIAMVCLSFTVSLSLNMPKKLRWGTLLLSLAVVLMSIQTGTEMTFLGHLIAGLVFYIALGLFAAGTKYKKIPVIQPAAVDAAV